MLNDRIRSSPSPIVTRVCTAEKEKRRITNIIKSKPRPCKTMIPTILDDPSPSECQNTSPFARLLLPPLARPSFDRTFQHNLLQTSHFLRFFLIIPNPFQADSRLLLQLGSYKERLDRSKDTQITRFLSLQSTCSVSIQKESKRFSDNCNSNLDFQALSSPPLINMFPSMLVHNEKQDLDSTFSGV